MLSKPSSSFVTGVFDAAAQRAVPFAFASHRRLFLLGALLRLGQSHRSCACVRNDGCSRIVRRRLFAPSAGWRGRASSARAPSRLRPRRRRRAHNRHAYERGRAFVRARRSMNERRGIALRLNVKSRRRRRRMFAPTSGAARECIATSALIVRLKLSNSKTRVDRRKLILK